MHLVDVHYAFAISHTFPREKTLRDESYIIYRHTEWSIVLPKCTPVHGIRLQTRACTTVAICKGPSSARQLSCIPKGAIKSLSPLDSQEPYESLDN